VGDKDLIDDDSRRYRSASVEGANVSNKVLSRLGGRLLSSENVVEEPPVVGLTISFMQGRLNHT
jgi:hypothetical protein